MKRVLLFLLASLILFTSCNSVKDAFHSQKETEIRTTVTEAEWNKMRSINNYTCRSVIGKNVTEEYVADNKKLFVSDGVELINDYDVNGMNGIFYKTEFGWSGSLVDSGWDAESIMLGSFCSLSDSSFEEAVYDEKEKCYIIEIKTEAYPVPIKFYFEDGNPVKIIIKANAGGVVNYAVITNIGNTTIDVSDLYITNDGKVESGNPDSTIRTTVTESEFESAMNIKSVTARVLDSGLGSFYKFTEEGFWLFDLHHDYIFNDGKEIYGVNIEGSCFLLENTDGKYVLGNNADSLTFALIPGTVINFVDAVYNEEGRYYVIELEPNANFDSSRAYLYFEDGVLVRIAVVKCVMSFVNGSTEPTPQYYEWILFLSDYETTRIDFPEYEIVN